MNEFGEYESKEDREFHESQRRSRAYRRLEAEKRYWSMDPVKMAEKFARDGGLTTPTDLIDWAGEQAVTVLGQERFDELRAERLAEAEKERDEDAFFDRVWQILDEMPEVELVQGHKNLDNPEWVALVEKAKELAAK